MIQINDIKDIENVEMSQIIMLLDDTERKEVKIETAKNEVFIFWGDDREAFWEKWTNTF